MKLPKNLSPTSYRIVEPAPRDGPGDRVAMCKGDAARQLFEFMQHKLVADAEGNPSALLDAYCCYWQRILALWEHWPRAYWNLSKYTDRNGMPVREATPGRRFS